MQTLRHLFFVEARYQFKILATHIPGVHNTLADDLSTKATDTDTIMLWGAAVLYFFGFFRWGELTVPTLSAYDSGKHLSWGDVSIDDPQSPKHLASEVEAVKDGPTGKGKGVDVLVGKTSCLLCPITGVLAYMVI